MTQLSLAFRDARFDAERVALALCQFMDTILPMHVLGDVEHPRTPPLCRARMVAAYILVYHFGHPCGKVGKALNKKRTTILYSISKAEDQVPMYIDMRALYVNTCNALNLDPHKSMRMGVKRQRRQRTTKSEQGGKVIPMRWSRSQRRAKRTVPPSVYLPSLAG